MALRIIKRTGDPLFGKCWEIYNYSFPEHKRRSLEEIKALIEYNPKKYFFCALIKQHPCFTRHKKGYCLSGDNSRTENVVGMLSFWDLAFGTLIENFAVNFIYKGMGIGSRCMKRIQEKYAGNDKALMADLFFNDVVHKAKAEAFYGELGFEKNYLPGCDIMSWPRKITDEEFGMVKGKIPVRPEGVRSESPLS
ncbi:MAG: GNAT family N-acetyltransferase [Bacteroidales bacterium]|jgi:GNAT superfamily N-acetyltransferase|nr:GNAT family N-acetyltransferase [Bacteroidales bacterium]